MSTVSELHQNMIATYYKVTGLSVTMTDVKVTVADFKITDFRCQIECQTYVAVTYVRCQNRGQIYLIDSDMSK